MSLDLAAVASLFAPDRLRFARQLESLTRAALADRAGVTPAAITQFEAGDSRPKPATVGRLALALGVPIEFFASTGRAALLPEPTDSFFRSLRRSTPRERERAAATAGLAAELAAQVELSVSLPSWSEIPTVPVRPDSNVEEAEAAAQAVRAAWGLGTKPIANVVRTLERHGIVVVRAPLVSTDVDAFSWAANGRPVVLLGDDKGVWERSRLDAAHELGHLVMHAADPEPGDKAQERQAQRFAGALLVPAECLADSWKPGRIDWVHLQHLRQQWGMSLAGLLYRAHELGLLAPTSYTNAMKYMSARGWRTKEPGLANPPEEPLLLSKALRLSAESGLPLEVLAARGHLLAADDLRRRLGLARSTGSSNLVPPDPPTHALTA